MHAVALYVVALWVPGLLLGRLAGLHQWTLVAAAPLLTYALAGVGGPALAWAGVPWSPVSAGLLVVVVAAVLAAIRWAAMRWAPAAARPKPAGRPVWARRWTSRLRSVLPWARRSPTSKADEPLWTRSTHLRVAAATAAVAAFGMAVIWVGVRRLSAVPQDWDAAFHANGIRWIATTGDSSLVGMGHINWFENGVLVFYPNAYHLVAALVLRLTGVDVPTVLNAQTVLLPGMAALAIVALVRRFGGRPALAVAAVACGVGVTAFYDMLWRGPLLPFTTGAVLMPLMAVMLVDLLDDEGWRSRIRSALLFAFGLVALICLNPAILFSSALFVLPAVVQRWVAVPRRLRREPLLVLGAGLAAAVIALPQLLGSLGSADGEPVDWPADLSPVQAVGHLLTLSHAGARPEWALAVAALIGLIRFRGLRGLQWTIAAGAIFALLFVITATSDAPWVNALTRPWWNDRWRFIGLCVVPIAVVAGHGLVEVWRWATAGVTKVAAGRIRLEPATTAAVLVGVLFLALSGGLYAGQNIARMRMSAPDGPVVSSLEVDAMHELATLVPPGQRVLNDRGDGSAWMYAIAGVLPIAGHYSAALIGPDSGLLAARFNQYATDPAVRAAVDRLHITYVMIDRGFVRDDFARQPGLVGLDRMRWLERVYENRDAVIYRIRPIAPARQ